jgi:hypothetical protein
VVITTNLDFAEWSRVFGDAKVIITLLDRLTHFCQNLETGKESHRFLHSSSTAKKRIKAREQSRMPAASPVAQIWIGADTSGKVSTATLYEGLTHIWNHPRQRLPRAEVMRRLQRWSPAG